VKAGQTVTLVGEHEASVRADVSALGARIVDGAAARDADWHFVAMDGAADLVRLDAVRADMKDTSGIWAVWPKGRKEFREDDIRNHALSIKLVDVKVMAWSATHSGLKLVVRTKDRA
jgi:hypothetical protein